VKTNCNAVGTAIQKIKLYLPLANPKYDNNVPIKLPAVATDHCHVIKSLPLRCTADMASNTLAPVSVSENATHVFTPNTKLVKYLEFHGPKSPCASKAKHTVPNVAKILK